MQPICTRIIIAIHLGCLDLMALFSNHVYKRARAQTVTETKERAKTVFNRLATPDYDLLNQSRSFIIVISTYIGLWVCSHESRSSPHLWTMKYVLHMHSSYPFVKQHFGASTNVKNAWAVIIVITAIILVVSIIIVVVFTDCWFICLLTILVVYLCWWSLALYFQL